MTVSTEIIIHSYYPGAGMAPERIPFQFLDADHLVVIDADGILQTQGTDYVISDGGASATASITTLRVFPDTTKLIVERITPRFQQATTEPYKPLPAEAVGRELDRRSLIEQEIDAEVGRSLRVPKGEDAQPLPSKAARTGKYLAGLPDGSFGTSVGTGSDPALRVDLGRGDPDGGSSIIAHAYDGADIEGSLRTLHRGRVDLTAEPFNIRGDGVTERSGYINLAIAYLGSRGGGTVILPPGVIPIATTIDNCYSNVRIEGSGGDRAHGAGTSFSQKTELKWVGDVGGTMMKVRTPYGPTAQRRVGQDLRRVDFDADSKAAVGLEINSVSQAIFADLHVRHATDIQYYLPCGVSGVDGPSGEPLDTQGCQFIRLSFDQRAAGSFTFTTAKGWYILGSINANVSGNLFELLEGTYSNGTAYDWVRSDNNVVIRCSAFRAGGDAEVYTWDLAGSESSTGTGSYGNTFIQIGWNNVYGFIFRSSNGADSVNTRVNTILGYDEANGGGFPVKGGLSRLIVLQANGTFDGLARLGVSQLDASPDHGISMEESGNRHDFYVSGNRMRYAGNGFNATWEFGANVDVLSAVGAYKCDGLQVVQERKVGWSLPTGATSRATFDPSTVTLPHLAERFAALLLDLNADSGGHGLIGT